MVKQDPVTAGSELRWSATYDGKEILTSAKIAMVLADGRILGGNEKVARASSVSCMRSLPLLSIQAVRDHR